MNLNMRHVSHDVLNNKSVALHSFMVNYKYNVFNDTDQSITKNIQGKIHITFNLYTNCHDSEMNWVYRWNS